VLIDPTVLSTLPRAHLRAGVAEMLKHGAIGDAYYFDAVAAFAAATHRDPNPDWTGTVALGLIARSVRFKADIVQRDERESGLRQVLNVGHTIAHAIERLSGFRVLHGEAVAIGLVLESRLAEWAGIARPGVASRLREALSAGGLPTALPRSLDLDALITAMRVDKKARGGRLSFALLAEIGRVAGDYAGGWTTVLGEDLIRAALAPSPSGPGNRAAADQPTV
jgi:3-dehydroquinate synthase